MADTIGIPGHVQRRHQGGGARASSGAETVGNAFLRLQPVGMALCRFMSFFKCLIHDLAVPKGRVEPAQCFGRGRRVLDHFPAETLYSWADTLLRSWRLFIELVFLCLGSTQKWMVNKLVFFSSVTHCRLRLCRLKPSHSPCTLLP